MAEAIAVGASVIAIIQITDRIIGLCKFYIELTQDALSHLRAILIEISALKTIFDNLKFLTGFDGPCSTTAKSLCGADGPIDGCLRSMIELEKLLPSDSVHLKERGRSKKERLRSTMASLAWPLKEKKAQKLLEEITHYKSTITLALTTDSIQDIKDTKARTSKIHDMLTESQKQEIYQWLQHTDPSPIHRRAQKDYEPGTGDWIFRSPEWTRFLERKDRCLWIHGIPGAGKTVLMSYLSERIQKYCDQPSQQTTTSAYYYCYFAHNQDETEPFLKWLIYLLCRKAEYIPADFNEICRYGKDSNLENLLNTLASIIAKFETVFIVLDAIDESCPREELLKVLQGFVADLRFKNLQIIVSSRNYFDIERIMTNFSTSVSMSNPFVEQDIRCRVRSVLQSRPQFRSWPHELLHEVEETLTTGAKGMFRWAVCQIDALQRLKCERYIVRKALKNLPKSLHETYDRILLAISEEDRLFIYHVLQWIAYHNELYNGEGIPCDLLIQAAEASIFELTGHRNERFYDKDILREICSCLIDISEGYEYVSFAHYTVREYLDSCRVVNTVTARRTVDEGNLKILFIEVTMSVAQRIKRSELWELQADITGNCDILEVINSDFNNYCVVSALLSLYEWPDQICQQAVLRALAIDLLDPSKAHYEAMVRATLTSEGTMQFFPKKYIYSKAEFWEVKWFPETCTEAIHIYNFLALTEAYGECVPLAKTFLQEKDHKSFLQTRLHFYREFWDVISGDMKVYEFDGPLIEVFAQLGMNSMNAFKILMELGAGVFDPSMALLFCIGGHEHSDCKDFCPIERLMELGADPNLNAYEVTPLQIATFHCDLEGVNTLLKAGAYPNCSGNYSGMAWKKGTRLSSFNFLHGASPLFIHRHHAILKGGLRDERKEDREKIEALLLEYGAEETYGLNYW